MDHTDLLTDKPVFSIELISALTKRKESLTAKYIYSAILKNFSQIQGLRQAT